MTVDATHPQYDQALADWAQMRITHKGQRAVRDARHVFLPPTSGMIADGMNSPEEKGSKAYAAYAMRSVYPDLVRSAVESMLGVMHNRPAVIDLPPAMEAMQDSATLEGESLQMLLRRINEEQLVSGRGGLLVDLPTTTDTSATPYIAFYEAESVINWDPGQSDGVQGAELQMVVLDESENERDDGEFEWTWIRKFRVLTLGDMSGEGDQSFTSGLYREDPTQGSLDSGADGVSNGIDFDAESGIVPSFRGSEADRIPFVFFNSKDIAPEPDEPPMLGLSNISLTIYRGEADYRQNLFAQGQDTLVTIGNSDDGEAHRIGAGASIDLPLGGDAKFIGVSADGLGEQRQAIEMDHTRAGKKAGEFVDETSRQREGEGALKIRVAARTATLNQIALAGAFALQEILRRAAVWMGADPEAVTVTPNLDFADDAMGGEELTKLMAAKGLGAPLSVQSIHALMVEKNVTELTLEEELAAIEEEKDLELVPPMSTDPAGPEDDPENPDDDDDDGDDEPEGDN